MGRVTITLPDDCIEEMDFHVQRDRCKNRSEWMERAANFYLAHQNSERGSEYLNRSVIQGVRQGLGDIERQTMPNIFGLSVELSMMNNLLASLAELDPAELRRLRSDCAKAVTATKKRTNLENAMRYQNDQSWRPNSFYDTFSGQIVYSYDDEKEK